MKKGVFVRFMFFFIVVVFVIAAANTAFGGVSSASSTASGGDSLVTSEAKAPTDAIAEKTARGYWMAVTEKDYAYGGDTVYYMGTKSSELLLGTGKYVPSIYSSMKIDAAHADGVPWKMPLDKIYSSFNIKTPLKHEIQYVRFVLDLDAFMQIDKTAAGSHGGTATFAWYQDPCIDCTNMDELDESCTPAVPYDATCININILNRNNCSVMADVTDHQQFCEGVPAVGGNEKETAAVKAVGVPGYGGCRIEEIDTSDPNTKRVFGRDWYTNPDKSYQTDPTKFLSDEFMASKPEVKKTIGNCCGNDPQDAGAIAVNNKSQSTYKNAYICFNNTITSSNANGDFVWASAQATDLLFKIITINRTEGVFDAVSNSNNWFVCGTEDKSLEKVYSKVSTKSSSLASSGIVPNEDYTSGILMDEYKGLPKPKDLYAKGTKILSGGAAGTSGAIGGSGTTASGLSSDDGIIDEETFTTDDYAIEGASEATACDKDGDGYDGQWSTDSSAGDWRDYDGVCKKPRQPYDCDDGSFDKNKKFSLGSLSRNSHPGAINYCVNGKNENLDCGSTACIAKINNSNKNPADILANPDVTVLNSRFICQHVDNRGEFTECCGWDLGYCFNTAKGRREGGAIHTLREFNDYNSGDIKDNEEMVNKTNFVLRYGVAYVDPDTYPPSSIEANETFYLGLFSDSNDLDLLNWSEYEYLEFYIWFTANFEAELWVGQYGGTSEEDPHVDVIENYIFPLKFRITDYVVNEPALRKWLHVVIPVDEIFQIKFRPDILLFSSNVQRISKLGSKVTVSDGDFSNIIGVDKIFLRPYKKQVTGKKTLPSGADNLYCSGTWPPVWIKDLDEAKTKVPSTSDRSVGQDACESIPSYGWTGNMCCGDDTGNDTSYSKKIKGEKTFREYYNDTSGGCWAGNKLPDNSRAMVLGYALAYPGYADFVNRSCFNTTCTYELPRTEGIFVSNLFPNIYDLSFADSEGGYQRIGAAGVAPSDNVFLKAENVPMQVLYYKGNFSTCNAADYIKNMRNTITNKPLIAQSFVSPNAKGQCSVNGGYYCDLSTGENLGWDDERVRAYSKAVNLTAKDGKQIALQKDSSGTIVSYANATLRIEIKRNYNLIDNGGFEDV